MTREEQIELMEECISDAMASLAFQSYLPLCATEYMAPLAAAFFQYRARQRDDRNTDQA